MNTPSYVACLDIGGTSVKSGIVSSRGDILESTVELRPVDSSGSADAVLSVFAEGLQSMADEAERNEIPLTGVGVSICGPFDYERGISKITGLDKYEAIYDVNVKQELIDRVRLSASMPVIFDVDSWAFARGEVWSGAGSDYRRVIVFTMGTGMGSAFAVEKKVVDVGPGVPWLGWVAGQKYRDGIVNDYVSRTYMIDRYQELAGERVDVQEMARRADAGDEAAYKVFREIGENLGTFLRTHHVKEFGADCILFGGRISYSFHLFETPFREALGEVDGLRAVVRALDIEGSALKGAARLVFDVAQRRPDRGGSSTD